MQNTNSLHNARRGIKIRPEQNLANEAWYCNRIPPPFGLYIFKKELSPQRHNECCLLCRLPMCTNLTIPCAKGSHTDTHPASYHASLVNMKTTLITPTNKCSPSQYLYHYVCSSQPSGPLSHRLSLHLLHTVMVPRALLFQPPSPIQQIPAATMKEISAHTGCREGLRTAAGQVT